MPILALAEASMKAEEGPKLLLSASPSAWLTTRCSSRSHLLPTTTIGGSFPVPSISWTKCGFYIKLRPIISKNTLMLFNSS